MRTVLAIDDDKTTLEILKSQLEEMGFRIFIERAAVKGLDIAKNFSPDVILLDLHMPVMDGFKVLSALKKDKTTKDIPVIMLTSNKEKDTVIEAMRHGVVDYIVKPHHPDKLNRKILTAVSQSGFKKQQSYEDFIDISRKGEIAVITMRGAVSEKGFQNDVKTVFNPFFLKQINGKVCILDLRSVEDLDPEGMKYMTEIVKRISGSSLKIVAGKHYGTIVSSTDIEEKAELFLSYGDLDLALNIG